MGAPSHENPVFATDFSVFLQKILVQKTSEKFTLKGNTISYSGMKYSRNCILGNSLLVKSFLEDFANLPLISDPGLAYLRGAIPKHFRFKVMSLW